MGVLCLSLFWYALLFCNHLEEEERAFSLFLLSYKYLVTVNVLCLFLTVTFVGPSV